MRTNFGVVLILLLLAASSIRAAALVDWNLYDPNSPVKIELSATVLTAKWDSGDGSMRLKLNLAANAKLLAAIEVAPKDSKQFTTVLQEAEIEFPITVGSRVPAKNQKFPYVFFDSPDGRPHETFVSKLEKSGATVESRGGHAWIRIAGMSAGPFKGELEIHLYDKSPLIRVEAALTPSGQNLAYIYDALLSGGVERVSFEALNGQFQTRALAGDKLAPLPVRYRTLIGQSNSGTVAVFPPPHSFFFPRDRTDNLSCVQFDKTRFGIRQSPNGGGSFVPWFDAPENVPQRMDFFLLASTAQPKELLEKVKSYTHGDTFKPIAGRTTFTSHYHSRLTVGQLAGRSPVREFAYVFKQMGVGIVHLAEFHGDGHEQDVGEQRLNEMKEMFNLCRTFSDDKLLLLPGEEGNKYLAHPWPPEKQIHPGHWMYFFPKPVYLTWKRPEGKPFSEEIEPYGKVYHVGDRDDMVRLLEEEKGLAWTTHPRIKASFATPDAFKDQPFYKSGAWLGAAWKAMPADLSRDRLGTRCLDLLDDMSNWAVSEGYALKALPGEVDVFEIDRNHELYGHMNVNYLKMDKLPAIGDAAPVLDVLRKREFFTTTGEILIHDFKISAESGSADVEWTFPLLHLELVSGDGKKVTRKQMGDLSGVGENQRVTFKLKLDDPDAKWVRLEAWDIARNFAYTQVIEVKK